MTASKATREQLRRHNRQLLLHAVYSGLADNRAALAQETGLAKPTVSDLIGELIEEGLLIEVGRGQSTDSGGKRPTLLQFVPDARQVIGVAVDVDRVRGVLCNMAGQIIAQHHAALVEAEGQEVIEILEHVINGLIAQLDAPLLCIGVGVSGTVDNLTGIVNYAPTFGWQNLPLVEALAKNYDVPIYIANKAEMAAMGQFAFGMLDDARNPVVVLINRTIEIGMVLGGAIYHNGGDIGSLRINHHNQEGQLETFLSWPHIKQRAEILRHECPNSTLPEHNLTPMHIQYGAMNGDPAATALVEEISDTLAQVFGWVIAMLRPDHISLAGAIVDMGEVVLPRAVEKTDAMLQPGLVQTVRFSLTESYELGAIGAVAEALHNELGLVR
jgi:predicted NBD/HSP70 family sugar kinase